MTASERALLSAAIHSAQSDLFGESLEWGLPDSSPSRGVGTITIDDGGCVIDAERLTYFGGDRSKGTIDPLLLTAPTGAFLIFWRGAHQRVRIAVAFAGNKAKANSRRLMAALTETDGGKEPPRGIDEEARGGREVA